MPTNFNPTLNDDEKKSIYKIYLETLNSAAGNGTIDEQIATATTSLNAYALSEEKNEFKGNIILSFELAYLFCENDKKKKIILNNIRKFYKHYGDLFSDTGTDQVDIKNKEMLEDLKKYQSTNLQIKIAELNEYIYEIHPNNNDSKLIESCAIHCNALIVSNQTTKQHYFKRIETVIAKLKDEAEDTSINNNLGNNKNLIAYNIYRKIFLNKDTAETMKFQCIDKIEDIMPRLKNEKNFNDLNNDLKEWTKPRLADFERQRSWLIYICNKNLKTSKNHKLYEDIEWLKVAAKEIAKANESNVDINENKFSLLMLIYAVIINNTQRANDPFIVQLKEMIAQVLIFENHNNRLDINKSNNCINDTNFIREQIIYFASRDSIKNKNILLDNKDIVNKIYTYERNKNIFTFKSNATKNILKSVKSTNANQEDASKHQDFKQYFLNESNRHRRLHGVLNLYYNKLIVTDTDSEKYKDNEVQRMIDYAIDGITLFLAKHSDEKRNIFKMNYWKQSTWNMDWQRATTYKKLLTKEDISVKSKLVILYALLASKEGEDLKKSVQARLKYIGEPLQFLQNLFHISLGNLDKKVFEGTIDKAQTGMIDTAKICKVSFIDVKQVIQCSEFHDNHFILKKINNEYQLSYANDPNNKIMIDKIPGLAKEISQIDQNDDKGPNEDRLKNITNKIRSWLVKDKMDNINQVVGHLVKTINNGQLNVHKDANNVDISIGQIKFNFEMLKPFDQYFVKVKQWFMELRTYDNKEQLHVFMLGKNNQLAHPKLWMKLTNFVKLFNDSVDELSKSVGKPLAAAEEIIKANNQVAISFQKLSIFNCFIKQLSNDKQNIIESNNLA